MLTKIPNKSKKKTEKVYSFLILLFFLLRPDPISTLCLLKNLHILSQPLQEQQKQVQQRETACWTVNQSLETSIFPCKSLNSTEIDKEPNQKQKELAITGSKELPVLPQVTLRLPGAACPSFISLPTQQVTHLQTNC